VADFVRKGAEMSDYHTDPALAEQFEAARAQAKNEYEKGLLKHITVSKEALQEAKANEQEKPRKLRIYEAKLRENIVVHRRTLQLMAGGLSDQSQAMPSSSHWWSWGDMWVIAGIVFAAIWFFSSSGNDLIENPPIASSDDAANARQASCSRDNVGAYVMAQEAVKIMLKNPRGAEFSYRSSDRLVREQPTCTYHVASWVDATNSFGGTVRRNWAMVLKKNLDGSWKRIDGPIFE